MSADERVRAHHGHLLVGQPRRFEKQGIWNADLADVVHDRCAADEIHLFTVEAERFGQSSRQPFDAFGMPAGTVVTVFGGRRQPLEHLDARVLEFLGAPVDAFEQRAILFADIKVEQPRLELVADPESQLDQVERLGQKVAGAEREGAAARLGEMSPLTTSTGRCSSMMCGCSIRITAKPSRCGMWRSRMTRSG